MAKQHTREKRTLVYPKGANPKDWLRFIQLPPFEHAWKRMDLTDDDLRALEIAIMCEPVAGDVIKGTGGIRKLRFAGAHWDRGKRGGIRIFYQYMEACGIVLLITAISKNRQVKLTQEQKKTIRSLVSEIKEHLKI